MVVSVSQAQAQAPARAEAEATLLDGDAGRAGQISAQGDDAAEQAASARRPAARIGGGEVSASASREGGEGRARASAVARQVRLLDGLVTATEVRRTATAAGGGSVRRAGRVAGLRIDGRLVGTVRGEQSYDLAGRGTVTVNRGAAGLRVVLTRATAGLAGGAVVELATVSASARDGADPAATPTPTPAPTPEPTPKPEATPDTDPSSEPPARRRRPPTDAQRLARLPNDFPVQGATTIGGPFGAARQIGAHQGNDIFAPFGAPVVAVADATVERVGTKEISGNRLWLRTTRGDTYFYAHVSTFAPAAVNGRRVRHGTVLGYVGNTGDAEPTPPHLHFEIHPDDGAAIDPRPILVAWRSGADVPPGHYGGQAGERPGTLVEVRDLIADG